MRARHFIDLVAHIRKTDVKNALSGACADDQKLKGDRRFARPGRALQNLESTPRKPSVQDIVETDNSALAFLLIVHSHGILDANEELEKRELR